MENSNSTELVTELLQKITLLEGKLEEKNIEVAQLKKLCETDSLTQVGNRRKFEKNLKSIISYNKRYKRQSALIFLDINKIKYINDNFGHDTGDQAIIFTAQTLSQYIRDTDSLYRFGGDEFIIILHNVSRDMAEQKMLDIQIDFNSKKFEYQDYINTLTVSAGLEMIEGNTCPITLINSADRKMYEEKRSYERS
ncbi:MAG: putative diguanylate cyclase AdrA [Proteobacteria bacterium]|nr:MAG: putative diguanylate cyclase AdrA [Pseudomonadota bacterium]|tara:strand:+ start:185 stop:769 length:585 start_codon:yes stop_codon:yes gene_type:complete